MKAGGITLVRLDEKQIRDVVTTAASESDGIMAVYKMVYTKPVHRLTRKRVGNKPIVVTLAPAGGQDDARIGLRRMGERTTYIVMVSDVYRWAALTHGNKERIAKAAARKAGIPWKRAKKKFNEENRI